MANGQRSADKKTQTKHNLVERQSSDIHVLHPPPASAPYCRVASRPCVLTLAASFSRTSSSSFHTASFDGDRPHVSSHERFLLPPTLRPFIDTIIHRGGAEQGASGSGGAVGGHVVGDGHPPGRRDDLGGGLLAVSGHVV